MPDIRVRGFTLRSTRATLMISLPLIVTQAESDLFIDALHSAVDAFHAAYAPKLATV
jgi:adenosylmethionine-8-amino-7-oxononanoate aminotransferase